MKMRKHGNGNLDHTTTTVTGDLPRIYHVKRGTHIRWTKRLLEGDIIFEYVDPGENTKILEEEIVYHE